MDIDPRKSSVQGKFTGDETPKSYHGYAARLAAIATRCRLGLGPAIRGDFHPVTSKPGKTDSPSSESGSD